MFHTNALLRELRWINLGIGVPTVAQRNASGLERDGTDFKDSQRERRVAIAMIIRRLDREAIFQVQVVRGDEAGGRVNRRGELKPKATNPVRQGLLNGCLGRQDEYGFFPFRKLWRCRDR